MGSNHVRKIGVCFFAETRRVNADNADPGPLVGPHEAQLDNKYPSLHGSADHEQSSDYNKWVAPLRCLLDYKHALLLLLTGGVLCYLGSLCLWDGIHLLNAGYPVGAQRVYIGIAAFVVACYPIYRAIWEFVTGPCHPDVI
jgi:hypothetical protein